MLSVNKKLIFATMFLVLTLNFVSAGVGLFWDEAAKMSPENSRTCMTYAVYNPFEEDTYATIELSDNLKSVLTQQETESMLIPAGTSSKEAIPVNFCFQVPKVYHQDCWLGDFFVCERTCSEPPVDYKGEVSVKSAPGLSPTGGSGGSVATMSVSAPLDLKVVCSPMSRNYTPLYIVIGIFALAGFLLVMKYKKPKAERYQEQMKALKAKMAKAKKR
jgi:hypothetical protein